jgi:hypothetical protein
MVQTLLGRLGFVTNIEYKVTRLEEDVEMSETAKAVSEHAQEHVVLDKPFLMLYTDDSGKRAVEFFRDYRLLGKYLEMHINEKKRDWGDVSVELTNIDRELQLPGLPQRKFRILNRLELGFVRNRVDGNYSYEDKNEEYRDVCEIAALEAERFGANYEEFENLKKFLEENIQKQKSEDVPEIIKPVKIEIDLNKFVNGSN